MSKAQHDGGMRCGVAIRLGRLDLEDCDISSDSATGKARGTSSITTSTT